MRYLTLLLVLFSLSISITAQKRRTVRKVSRAVVLHETPPPPPSKAERVSLGTVIEKYVSDYDLKADGTGTETRTVQQRCLSEICVERTSSYRQIFNGDLQKIRVIDAYVLKADGKQVKVPESAIVDQPTDQTAAAPGFSSLRQFEITFDELKVGDAIFVKFETLTTRATFDGHFDGLEVFPLLYDWKSIEINVTGPSNLPLFIEATGLDGGKLADENGRSRWQYRKLNSASIPVEPAMHDVGSISPRFALTTFSDAGALGKVFWENVRAKAVVTPEIQTLADEITKDAKTPLESASAIYQWANSNIRYLLIVLDRGGWNPHSSTEIVKNGYGDCKDYVTIIHTLLKAKGIDSSPVLIRADAGNWFPSVATADYFNHAILYIPSLNLFADATAPNTRLGLISGPLVGKRAILSGEKTGIIQLPKDNPVEDQIVSDMTLDFRADGGVKASSKNTYLGRSEIIFKPMFSSPILKRESATFMKVILSYYGIDGSGKILSVGDPTKVGEPFRVEMEANVDNLTAFLPKGKLQIPPGLNMVSTASLEQLVTTESRKTSINVGASTIRENLSVNLPAGVRVIAPPAAVNFSNAVGSLKTSPALKTGGLTFSRELVFFKDVVEPADYPLLKELIKKLLEANNLEFDYSTDASLVRAAATVARKPVPAAPKNDSWDAMLDRIAKLDGLSKLTAADARRMEKRIAANPNDAATRVSLVKYFSFRGAWVSESTHVQHRVWLIRNKPEISDEELYGISKREFSPASIELLKTAWVETVAANKDRMEVRLNAVRALKTYAAETATNLAEEGAKVEPENYDLLFLIAEINSGILAKTVEGKVAASKVVDYGRRALARIKNDRSRESDNDRSTLLKQLGTAALRLGDLDAATNFSQELVLNFGQSSIARVYDEAAHAGNTTLGLVEIRRNNLSRAKEHLLASIRAPLRMGYNNLSKIDTSLARELFEKGEKDVVLEYLKLCLGIQNFKIYPESYANEIFALKLWIGQIEKGTKPNFDFSSPESKLPLPKPIVRPASKSKKV